MAYCPEDDGALCSICPLGPHGALREPGRPFQPVRGEFHPGAKVLAVAESPADAEVAEGAPLRGKSGLQAWNPALVNIGRKRADVDLDNVVACELPGEASGAYKRFESTLRQANELRKLKGLDPLPHPAACCKPRLDKVVSRYRNLIALGGTAAKALTGRGDKILAARGDVREIPTSTPGASRLVMLTVHPAFVLRAPHYREFFEGDLAKAFRWFEGKRNWTEPLYEWRPEPDRLRSWLREKSRFTVHDYETTLDGPLRSRVYCVVFTRLVEPSETRVCEKCAGSGRRHQRFSQDDGWSPAPPEEQHLTCECCKGKGSRLVEVHSVLVPIMSCEDQNNRFYSPVAESEIWQIIGEHNADPEQWKVGHNLTGFDVFLDEANAKTFVWPVVDTLPLARHRNPAAKKGLKVVGGLLCDVHAWGASVEGTRIAEAPRSDKQLHYYCGMDGAVNAKVYDRLIADAKDRGYFRPLRDELRPASWPARHAWSLFGVDQNRQEMCRHMTRAGMYIDQARREKHSVQLDREARNHRFVAMTYAHSLGVTGKVSKTRTEAFNPGSDKQVAHLLFDVWGRVPTRFSKETGQRSVDDEVLRETVSDPDLPEDRRVFVDAIRRYKRARKAKASFVMPLARRDLWVPEYTRKGRLIGIEPLCYEDGRVRSNWSAMITSVSRLNGNSPALQVIPPRFRDQFAAQPIYPQGDSRYPGRILIGGDVDQFHLRIIANRWRIGRLLEAFKNGIDPHSSLALDWFEEKFRNADGWGPDGFSLKRKPKKDSAADKMRHLAKIIRYRGAYADDEEGLLQTVKKVEDPDTGDLPFAHMTLREVKKLYRIWMRAEPEWFHAWNWVTDQYTRNGGWIEEPVFGRRSGDLEGGKKQAVVNYDILASEPSIFTLIESDLRSAFPDDFEGPGTGVVHQGHDACNVEAEGFAWVEVRDGRKVVVCDEKTEKKRLIMQECMNVDLSRALGWEVPITSTAQVGPVRDEHGRPCLSNWKEA